MTALRKSAAARDALFIALFRQTSTALLRGLLDVFRHSELPGYAQLPWTTRCRINAEALLAFIGSRSCARLTLWLIAWLLASYLLVWHYDLRGPAAATLPLLALLWVLPWCARVRRSEVARLLQHRWPG
jgi:hypothetical protein